MSSTNDSMTEDTSDASLQLQLSMTQGDKDGMEGEEEEQTTDATSPIVPSASNVFSQETLTSQQPQQETQGDLFEDDLFNKDTPSVSPEDTVTPSPLPAAQQALKRPHEVKPDSDEESTKRPREGEVEICNEDFVFEVSDEKTPPPAKHHSLIDLSQEEDVSSQSIIVLDDSNGTTPKSKVSPKPLPKFDLRVPLAAFSSEESTSGTTQSEPIFKKLVSNRGANKETTKVNDNRDREEDKISSDTAKASDAISSSDREQLVADDEASRSFTGVELLSQSSRADSASGHNLVITPDITVSPIHVEGSTHKTLAEMRKARKTSTPGNAAAARGRHLQEEAITEETTPKSVKRSPRKRAAASMPSTSKAVTPSSEDDEQLPEKTKRRKKPSSPKKPKEDNDAITLKRDLNFKVPDASVAPSDLTHLSIRLGPVSLSDTEEGGVVSQSLSLRRTTSDEQSPSLQYVEYKVPREKAAEVFKLLQDHLEKVNIVPKVVGSKKRLSDVTSISSNSRSSSMSASTGGYLGDASSGVSSLSAGSDASSKRDRLSIMPDLAIHKHNVVSPLPKRFQTVKVQPEEPKKVEEEEETIVEEEVNVKKCLKLKVGSKVLAMFRERITQVRYWPATVLSKCDKTDKWQIQFDEDRIKLSLPLKDLIPADGLLPGHHVSVVLRDKDSGSSQQVILTAYPDMSQGSDNPAYPVHVPHANEDRRVHFDELFLTAEQARKIKEDLGDDWKDAPKRESKTSADLSLDNLVESGRRTRASPIKTPSTPPTKKAARTTPAKQTPTRQRRKRGGADVETSAVEDTEAEVVTPAVKTPASSRKRAARKNREASLSHLPTSDEEEMAKPEPPSAKARKGKQQQQIFHGMSFLLTQGTREVRSEVFETETEESELDRSMNEMDAGPIFDRISLRTLIEKNGGRVLASFPDGTTEGIPENVHVLSDRSCKTMTFLLAITYGFPRLSFQWAIDSARGGKALAIKSYSLPVGYSELQCREVEHHEARPEKQSSLLVGNHVALVSGSKEFLEDWTPLLTRLGASVTAPGAKAAKFPRGTKKIDYVVCDRSNRPATEKLLQVAKMGEMVIVSTKWVIESLINGVKVSPANYRI